MNQFVNELLTQLFDLQMCHVKEAFVPPNAEVVGGLAGGQGRQQL